MLDNKLTEKAIKIVRNGGIVIFPTDTAFGIGCRIDSKKAVDRLFSIKRRSRKKAVPILVSSKRMALFYLSSPTKIVRFLMHQYWPGALTIVAPCKKEKVYSPVRGGGDNIGVRMPNYSLILEIIKSVGVPILGPSANFSQKQTPYSQENLDPNLVEKVDLVVPGKCKIGIVSTVIDCSVVPAKILRQGAVRLK